MFSHYYVDKRFNEKDFKIKMYETFELSKFVKAKSFQSNMVAEEPKLTYLTRLKLKWNKKINVLATLIYELLKLRDENGEPWLEGDIKLISEIVHEHVVDKNRKPISKDTFHTCLKDSREEKRANEGNRIKIEDILPDLEEN